MTFMRKHVIFLPCCKSKSATGYIEKSDNSLSKKKLPQTWEKLQSGRAGMTDCIDKTTLMTSAIFLYKGSPYNVFQSELSNIIHEIRSGEMRLYIISAGYGIVDALEPIHNYDAKLQSKVAKNWKNYGLHEIISEILLREQSLNLFGFFAGTTNWNSPGSKYRYFFTQGVTHAMKLGLKPETAGCFYRVDGRGSKAILGALGRTFTEGLKNKFLSSYVENIETNYRHDRNVVIGFERIQ